MKQTAQGHRLDVGKSGRYKAERVPKLTSKLYSAVEMPVVAGIPELMSIGDCCVDPLLHEPGQDPGPGRNFVPIGTPNRSYFTTVSPFVTYV
jgi:hypothetical protein